MDTKFYSLCLLTFIFPLMVFSQDHRKKFTEALQKGDTVAQKKVLTTWAKAGEKDPELLIAYFNYHINRAKNSIISLTSEKKKGENLVLTKEGSDEPVAFLGAESSYNEADVLKGLAYLDEGIKLYPDRLDMRFGRIHMLGEIEDFQSFTSRIIETIEYGASIKHNWLWKDGEKVEDGKNFLLESIQGYVGTIYNTEKDELLPLMRKIAEAVLKYDPTHVPSLSNIGLTYVIVGDNSKALPYFLRAEKEDASDIIILFNLAQTYKRLDQKAKAKEYYEKILKIGSDEDKEAARDGLKSLKD